MLQKCFQNIFIIGSIISICVLPLLIYLFKFKNKYNVKHIYKIFLAITVILLLPIFNYRLKINNAIQNNFDILNLGSIKNTDILENVAGSEEKTDNIESQVSNNQIIAGTNDNQLENNIEQANNIKQIAENNEQLTNNEPISVDNDSVTNIEQIVDDKDQIANNNQIIDDNTRINKIENYNIFKSNIEIKNNVIYKINLYLPNIWLFGIIAMLLYYLIVYKIYVHNLKIVFDSNSEIENMIDNIKAKMNIKNRINYAFSSNLTTPISIGILKKKIIIPSKNCNSNDLEYMLKHEIFHLKNKDLEYKFILIILNCIYWFNPIIYFFTNMVNEILELNCDYNILEKESTNYRIKYGEVLLSQIEINRNKQEKFAMSFSGSRRKIMERFSNIVNDTKKEKVLHISITLCALLIISLLIILLIPNIDIATTDTPATVANLETTTYENEYEKQILEKDSKNNDYKIIEINEEKYSGYLVAVYDASRIQTVVTEKIGETGQYLTEMSENNDALVAINGGAFSDSNFNIGSSPVGITVSNGSYITTDTYSGTGGLIGFTENNKLVLGAMNVDEAKTLGIRDAVTCGPFLIVDGKTSEELINGGWGNAPRTAIGQREDGIVLLLVVDGRKDDKPGADMSDLIEIMERYGAYNAANLDGGTSSALVVNNTIVNDPIDSTGAHKTRTIATGFIVTKDESDDSDHSIVEDKLQ